MSRTIQHRMISYDIASGEFVQHAIRPWFWWDLIGILPNLGSIRQFCAMRPTRAEPVRTGFIRPPLYWAAALAILLAAMNRASAFWSLPLLGLLGPFLIGIALLIFYVSAIARAATALFRRRYLRALSFGCALILVPSIALANRYLPIFDPYFWYVLAHRTMLEQKAESIAGSRKSFPAVLETRDVSEGLVANPPIFTAIVYDEGHDVAGDLRRQTMRCNTDRQVNWFWCSTRTTYTRHLFGGFYVLFSTER